MKREGISTLFIHGYPWALSYMVLDQLAFDFQLLEIVVCVCFENVLKRGHHCGNLCNDYCLNVYKGVCLLKKRFKCLKVCFGKMF